MISPKLLETWCVFTDGACETGVTGGKLGGVSGVLVPANEKETRMELDKGWIWIDPCQKWVGKCVARRFGIHHGQHPPIVGRTFGLKSACK